MELVSIKHDVATPLSVAGLTAIPGLALALADAGHGDADAYFDLGVAYSTGSHGTDCDLVEAHKWFNLAAVAGHQEAPVCRAEVADDMTAREIAEAQRRARQWLASAQRRAA